MMPTKQESRGNKIRSVSDGREGEQRVVESATERMNPEGKIRSVSDGREWGWGPTRE
jgi:hypothetical protein